MRTLRRILATALLTFLLVVPAFAGEMGTNGVTSTGEMGIGNTATDGEMSTGATLATDPIREMALNLLQGVLSLL